VGNSASRLGIEAVWIDYFKTDWLTTLTLCAWVALFVGSIGYMLD
jgi:hypothetical protein